MDPLAEQVGDVVERLDREGLRLALVVDTHTHADHASGGADLAARAGVPYALHEATESGRATERLRDGQRLEVGDLDLEVIHTPGHSPDSVTLRCGRDLFTGDFLFLAQDGAGRLDLPGGDPGAHWDSLRKLSALADEHRVLPGHDYNELTDSTLGEERVRNPRFQDVTREEYVAWQRAVAMPTPDWMLDVIAANLGTKAAHAARHSGAPASASAGSLADVQGAACVVASSAGGGGGACQGNPVGRGPRAPPRAAARGVGGGGGGGAAGAGAAASAVGEPPFLLDVREPWEFSAPLGRHAPGAHLVPLGQLPYRLDEMPQDPARELLVICRTGARSARAAEFLIERGWRRVFNVAGGTDLWAAEGLPVER